MKKLVLTLTLIFLAALLKAQSSQSNCDCTVYTGGECYPKCAPLINLFQKGTEDDLKNTIKLPSETAHQIASNKERKNIRSISDLGKILAVDKFEEVKNAITIWQTSNTFISVSGGDLIQANGSIIYVINNPSKSVPDSQPNKPTPDAPPQSIAQPLFIEGPFQDEVGKRGFVNLDGIGIVVLSLKDDSDDKEKKVKLEICNAPNGSDCESDIVPSVTLFGLKYSYAFRNAGKFYVIEFLNINYDNGPKAMLKLDVYNNVPAQSN